ncbi:MAG: hypothetical protein JOZ42_00805 [Acetobacteraceae bacterium]|nr:hypothetical protein [Acetobacteraceae bacterium]
MTIRKKPASASVLLAGLGASLVLPAVAAPQTPSWMKVNAQAKSVALDIVAGSNANNGALNFNGYYGGDMTVVIPQGWTVKVTFTNHDGMLPHSVLVTKNYAKDEIPPQAGVNELAVSKAYSNNPESGLSPNEHDDFSFKATTPGDYLLFCGVPGHGVQGMYVNLKVDAGAQQPEIEVAQGAEEGRP